MLQNKKALSLILIFVSAIIIIVATVNWLNKSILNSNSNLIKPVSLSYLEEDTYTLKTKGPFINEFTNHVDGYKINISSNMTINMKDSHIRAVIENDECTLEIYRQPIESSKNITNEAYIRYSNSQIKEENGYRIVYDDNFNLLDQEIYIFAWSRAPLKGISNDKFHYGTIDITTPGISEVYTIFVKSNKPLVNKVGDNKLIKVAENFKVSSITKKPYIEKKQNIRKEKWTSKTKEIFNKYFGENADLKWGIFEPEAPLEFQKLKELENKIQYEFPILVYYTGFIEGETEHPRLEKALQKSAKEKRLLELTLQTYPLKDRRGNMVYDILNGKYDQFLNHYAGLIKESKTPVLFRLGNEMNGDWCSYSAIHTSRDAEIYKEFYKYIYRIFENVGANNVIWVWNPNSRSFPDFKWNHELCYYPGDQYVDIVGMTAYNTGTYYDDELWESFDELYSEIYEVYSNIYEQPLMITEFASSSIGGDKVSWVENMFNSIAEMENVKVAIWWSSCDYNEDGEVSRPYFMDETEDLIKVFKRNLSLGK